MSPHDDAIEAQLAGGILRLTDEYRGVFSPGTVERFARESFDALAARATVTDYLPLFAYRFARERLKALAQAEELIEKELPEVLYVCAHNAGRSQMAALLTSRLAAGRVGVRSAGSDPVDQVNPQVVRAMREIGIDMDEAFPKPLTDEVVRAADAVITMGCGDACPIYPGKRYKDWGVADPAGQPLEVVREIREDIRERVEALLAELGVSAGAWRA